MTNPSPMSPKERAALRERDNADSYYRRTLLGQDDDSVGRHAKEAPVVGHSAKYPEARPPWNDPIAKAAMNDAPDQFGVDLTKAPDLGDAPPRRELATSADPDLSSLRDSEGEFHSDAIFAAYQAWCQANNIQYVPSKSVFAKQLLDACPEITKTHPRTGEIGRPPTYVGISPREKPKKSKLDVKNVHPDVVEAILEQYGIKQVRRI